MSEALVVTGAAGWLGGALMDEVATTGGFSDVRALALPGQADEITRRLRGRLDVQVVEGDISDAGTARRLLDGLTSPTVIHAAGMIHPARVADFDRINATGTRNIVAAAVAAGARRIVHISSNSPFGLNSSPDDRFRASEPFNPYMGYGRSKMAAEIAVRDAAASGAIEAVVLRPPWFYGPGQPERQAKFLSMVRSGRFPIPGDGTQRRSMVYVPDLARAAVLATAPSAAPGAYWIADPTPYQLREVVAMTQQALVAEGFPVRPGHRTIPMALSTIARRMDGVLQSRGRYSTQIHVLGELGTTIACEVGPATDAIGWTPGPGLVEGMRVAVRDWLARGYTID